MPHDGGMISRRLSLGIAVSAIVAVLAGCAPSAPTLAAHADGYAVVNTPQSSAMDAMIAGRIAVDDAGCWGIRSDDVFRHVLWPAGTRLDGGGILAPGLEESVGEGTPVTGGGGEMASDSDQAPCWEQGDIVFVLSPDGVEYGFA